MNVENHDQKTNNVVMTRKSKKEGDGNAIEKKCKKHKQILICEDVNQCEK